MISKKTNRFENLLHHYNYTYKNNENKRAFIKGKMEKIISQLPKAESIPGRNRLYNFGDHNYESPLAIKDFEKYDNCSFLS